MGKLVVGYVKGNYKVFDKLEAFTSFNGPDFYELPSNISKIKLTRTPWKGCRGFLMFIWRYCSFSLS
ncbi:hypothetical protein Peur_064009 [Populus x canadensis]